MGLGCEARGLRFLIFCFLTENELHDYLYYLVALLLSPILS